ncbi:MAG: phosphoribosylglycinamide formyltransferase [Gammaproteobacteria bacterium]|nr:phosphoribosylglycinamide formyltransferase [Gammaproteobacteria bacterium]
MKKIIVFASGGGSNFQALIDALKNEKKICIKALVVDRNCGALKVAKDNQINSFMVNRHNDKFYNSAILKVICADADLIVCAGYLSIISAEIVQQFPEKIINIHPSLLPAFGGSGMYGMKVHEAVIASHVHFSGCTVHFVDCGIDSGTIIKQISVCVNEHDTPETLQKKVLVEEHKLLPEVVKELLS